MVKVRSKGTLIDGNFQINDNEVKELPSDYKRRPGIMCNLGNMLEVIGCDKPEKKSGEAEEVVRKDVLVTKQEVHVTKQEKVLGFKPDVYLDQNSRVVSKMLRDTTFSRQQLRLLKECEEGDNNRKSVLRVIKSKLKKKEKD